MSAPVRGDVLLFDVMVLAGVSTTVTGPELAHDAIRADAAKIPSMVDSDFFMGRYKS